MNHDLAINIHAKICDQFFFNRKNIEVIAGNYDDDSNPSELVFDIFSEVIALNVIHTYNDSYAIELVSSNKDLYITPIIELFNLEKEDIIATYSGPIILQTRKRPLEIGCSIGPINEGWRGTLGCFVKDIDDGSNYVLSNHHVLFSEGDYKDNFIVQPSTYDGGSQNDAVGLYVRSLAPETSGINKFDAAVAGPISTEFSNLIPGLDVKTEKISNAFIGMRVYKTGATTGKTFGIVTSIVSAIKVGPDGAKIEYEDQITINGTTEDFLHDSIFSLPGDSGSVVIEYDSNRIVGLLFCGNGEFRSHANKINSVFTELRISL